MGFYNEVLLPRGIDFCMSFPFLEKYRKEVLSGVVGSVLEIGFGSGLNLPHYPPSICEITAVDVNPGMNSLARKRIERSPITVDQHTLNGEQLPMEDESFDCVVSAWTLCSIANVDQALAEIKRVLKPGGQLLFIEHGWSEDPKVQRWQNWLTPMQKIIFGGCHFNRDIKGLIEKQEFHIDSLKNFYLENTLGCIGYTYQGTAIK